RILPLSTGTKGLHPRIPGKRGVWGVHPAIALFFLLGVIALSFGDLMEIIPLLAPLVASPLFPFFHEIHDLLAAGLVIYATYKYRVNRLGVAAILLYVAVHIPYFIIQFPENAPELLRVLFSAFGAAFGVWLIRRLYKTEDQMEASQETLSRSEVKYRDLYENAPVAYYSVGTDGLVKECNKAFQLLLGYSKEELVGKDRLELFAPGNIAKAKVIFENFKNAIPIENEELVYLTKDGREIYGLLSANPVFDENGQVVLSRSVVKDITEHKKMELELIESEERLRTTVENAPFGIATSGLDRQFLTANPSFCRILGYTESELRRMTFKDITLPEDTSKSIEQMTRLDAGRISSFSQEKRYIRKDGEVIVGRVSVSLVRDQKHNPRYYVAELEDVTEQRRAEENLLHSAKEWESTFDSVTDLVSIHSRDLRVIKANKAFANALHKTKDEVVGRYCYELFHDTDKPPAFCPHDKTLVHKTTTIVEEFEPSLGIWVQIAIAPVIDEKGEVIATVHTTRDISERKRMQEQLIAQDRLASIGQLVSGVAHEINNPLTGVIGFSELLLNRKDLPEDVKADLKIVNDEAMRTVKIVKNLLTFARRQPEGKAPVDINEQIQRVLGLRNHEQKVNNINIVTHFASDLPKVMGNSSQLQQVFFNIVINAEFFMLEAHQKGNLTITTKRSHNLVLASFTDDGPGISEENMKSIFSPFFTTKEVGKGTGLGLSICYGIITEHGGKIYAENEPGKGAAFIVELPINKETTNQDVAR
ncbi:MAG: PAS domain S-box protein, partial [Dehalococcoidales bacterium]|nr:PAS domain S-box protein [Dehalococcoidales bacterium]